MISTTATQNDIIASSYKSISWLFDVVDKNSVEYHWSTKSRSYGGTAYTFKITNFRGITLNRGTSELGIQSPSAFSFGVPNKNNTLTASDFDGGTVLLKLVVSDGTNEEILRQFKFRIKYATDTYQLLNISCEDFIQQYLEGDYPNTASLSAIFPPSDKYESRDLCVPSTFGTPYIPLRPVLYRSSSTATPERFYLLGEVGTYSISKVRAPRTLGATSWSTAFDFTQSTVSDTNGKAWQVFQPIIEDSDNDGVADACGVWAVPSQYCYDMPTQFSKDSSVGTTSPSDVIESFMLDIGTPSTDIDSDTFTSASATFASWGLSYNGAFYYKETRGAVLASLLNQCHSTLYNNEKIELKVLSKVSQKTITNADVMKTADVGTGTFKTSMITQTQSDSGYMAFQNPGEAQDELVKYLVPAKATTDNISSNTLPIPFVQNSIHAQNIGSLYYQRKLLKESTHSFTGKAKLIALQPDDVITVNDTDYGGSYDVLIDSMTINKDASIGFKCTKFKYDLDDWDDLSFGSATLATEDVTDYWTTVISGPDSTLATTSNPNVFRGKLRIEKEGGGGLILTSSDYHAPYLEVFSQDGTTQSRLGNLNGYLGYTSNVYGIGIGETDKYLKYDKTNGLRIKGNITATSGTIGSFTIGTYLYTGSKTAYNDANAGVHIGGDGIGIGNNVFTVSAAGALVATSVLIGDASSYVDFSGGALSIKIASGETFDLYGGMNVKVGGDITLEGADSNPGLIKFVGTGYTTTVGSPTVTGATVDLKPETDRTVVLHIGDTGRVFSQIGVSARTSVEINITESSSVSAGIIMYNTSAYSYCGLTTKFANVTKGVDLYYNSTTLAFRPIASGIDLGGSSASYKWKDFYLSGTAYLDGNIDMGDSDYIKMGTGDDFQLYHSGSNSYIINGTGDLYIEKDSTHKYFVGDWDGTHSCVHLYYDNSLIFGTHANGVTLLGTMYIQERASAAADGAGYGQIWVNSSDSKLYFTDDGGTDHEIAFV